jgi:hypothetical protein
MPKGDVGRYGGYLTSTPQHSDKQTVAGMKRCVHCQKIWVVEKGSGKLAGFCTRCMGDVCGEPSCVARGCLHWEAQLEQMEAGIPFEMTGESLRPVIVAVPDVPPG